MHPAANEMLPLPSQSTPPAGVRDGAAARASAEPADRLLALALVRRAIFETLIEVDTLLHAPSRTA